MAELHARKVIQTIGVLLIPGGNYILPTRLGHPERGHEDIAFAILNKLPPQRMQIGGEIDTGGKIPPL